MTKHACYARRLDTLNRAYHHFDLGPPVVARGPAAWLALASGMLAALVPKGPMCLAGYLSAFGVTVGAASATIALLRPLGVMVSGLALAFAVLRWTRRRAVLPSPQHELEPRVAINANPRRSRS